MTNQLGEQYQLKRKLSDDSARDLKKIEDWIKNYKPSKEEVKEINGELNIWLKEKAVDGKANLMLVKILKKYFGCDVKIKSGFTSRIKVVEI